MYRGPVALPVKVASEVIIDGPTALAATNPPSYAGVPVTVTAPVRCADEEDFTACLGFKVEGLDEHISKIDPANFKKMIATAVKEFPNFKVAATTLRNAKTATFNDWSAVVYAGGEFYQSMMRENLEIFDRVGGGDGFASGLAYGFLEGKGPQAAVEYGAAHGALAMTTPGDTSMVNVKEVEAVMKGKGARVIR